MTIEQQKAFGVNQFTSFLLAEAYIRKPSSVCTEFLVHLKNYLNDESHKDEFLDFCDKKQLDLHIIKGTLSVGGYFDLKTRKIVFLITQDILNQICVADKQELEVISKNLWINFTHEDTHAQQFNKSKVKIPYKQITTNYWDEDLGKDFGYFNQSVEADAYGREIAARLETIYSDDNVASILIKINANSIEDDYAKKLINVYKDPRISDKASHAFFRAIYDFLVEENIEV